jgi:quercetin dioxygenase-like cupin family protein
MTSCLDLVELVERSAREGGPAIEIEGQMITCHPAFETPRTQAALFRLQAGQRIPAHMHSAVDDIFFGVRGTGRIRIWDSTGGTQEHRLEAGTLIVVTPETPHEVSCVGDEVWYVLVQAPKALYDNMAYEVPEP